jgi:hypothetical protein
MAHAALILINGLALLRLFGGIHAAPHRDLMGNSLPKKRWLK